MQAIRTATARTAAAAAVLLATACTVGQKQATIEKAVDDPGRRREGFEATLRVLDENPQYVDEFFELARRHDRTLNRFTADFARGLADPTLARMAAGHLVQAPAGLREILVATLDAARPKPEARRSIARAIGQRSETAAGILSDHPAIAVEVGKAFARAKARAIGEAIRGPPEAEPEPDAGTGSGR